MNAFCKNSSSYTVHQPVEETALTEESEFHMNLSNSLSWQSFPTPPEETTRLGTSYSADFLSALSLKQHNVTMLEPKWLR